MSGQSKQRVRVVVRGTEPVQRPIRSIEIRYPEPSPEELEPLDIEPVDEPDFLDEILAERRTPLWRRGRSTIAARVATGARRARDVVVPKVQDALELVAVNARRVLELVVGALRRPKAEDIPVEILIAAKTRAAFVEVEARAAEAHGELSDEQRCGLLLEIFLMLHPELETEREELTACALDNPIGLRGLIADELGWNELSVYESDYNERNA